MGWLSALPAIVCLTVAVLHLARLAPSSVIAGDPPDDQIGELAHLLTALGMAAMFSPIDSPLPPLQWVVFFGLTGAWFMASALRAGVRGGDATDHVVHSVAMIVMVQWWSGDGAVAASGSGEHAGHGGNGSTGLVPVVAVLCAGYFIWYGARCADRLRVARGTATGAPSADLAMDGAAAEAPDPDDERAAEAGPGAATTGGGLAVAARPRVRTPAWTVRAPETVQVAHIVMAVAMCGMMLAAV